MNAAGPCPLLPQAPPEAAHAQSPKENKETSKFKNLILPGMEYSPNKIQSNTSEVTDDIPMQQSPALSVSSQTPHRPPCLSQTPSGSDLAAACESSLWCWVCLSSAL